VDGFDRRVAVAYFRALFRGSLLALVAFAAATLALGGARPDMLLAAGLATVCLLSLLWARLLRARALQGPGMVAAILLLAAASTLCMVPTGGIRSPVVLLVATSAAVGGLTLGPVGVLVAMSGISVLQAALVLLEPAAPPVRELVVQLALLGLLGFVVNLLACRLREQRAELAGLSVRDPLSGALRRSFFRARLVALLEDAHRDGRGVALLLLDLGSGAEARIEEAGTALLDAVRGDDLVGRVGDTTFAVAAAAPGTPPAEGIAERLARRLRPIAEPRLGLARVAPVEGDPIALAGRLFSEAEAALEAPGSQLAAGSPQPLSSASAP
jgi:GGDEF domain-containing protein